MTYAALQIAFWLLALGVGANVVQIIDPKNGPGLRATGVVFISLKVFVLVGIWPLVWGGA